MARANLGPVGFVSVFASTWILGVFAYIDAMSATRALSANEMQEDARGGPPGCYYQYNKSCDLENDQCPETGDAFDCVSQGFCQKCTESLSYSDCIAPGALYEICDVRNDADGCGNLVQGGCHIPANMNTCECDDNSYEVNPAEFCERKEVQGGDPCPS